MANLIKMDARRLFRSPMFLICLCVTAFINIVTVVGMTLGTKLLMPNAPLMEETVSSVFTNPFYIPLLIILMFASLISFSYADIAGGYVKNIAGQLKRRSDLVVSKYIVIGIHNLLFLLIGSLSHLAAAGMLSASGMMALTNDGQMLAAFGTLMLKWLLSMGISAILLFLTNGVKNKVLATVIGVILGTGSLSLAYMGLSTAINNVFHTQDFNLSLYMPDSLMSSVNIGAGTAVWNAVIVSLVCAAVFLALTVRVFNTRDVK